MSAEEYLTIRDSIVDQLSVLNTPQTDSYVVERWNWFDQHLNLLAQRGWTRGQLLNLLWDISFQEYSLTEETLDQVGNFIATIIGHCDSSGIKLFPGEPHDHEELVEYVRGEQWKEPRNEVWGLKSRQE